MCSMLSRFASHQVVQHPLSLLVICFSTEAGCIKAKCLEQTDVIALGKNMLRISDLPQHTLCLVWLAGQYQAKSEFAVALQSAFVLLSQGAALACNCILKIHHCLGVIFQD
eukprot:365480-Chlamydomonas_euryale.AAC.7